MVGKCNRSHVRRGIKGTVLAHVAKKRSRIELTLLLVLFRWMKLTSDEGVLLGPWVMVGARGSAVGPGREGPRLVDCQGTGPIRWVDATNWDTINDLMEPIKNRLSGNIGIWLQKVEKKSLT